MTKRPTKTRFGSITPVITLFAVLGSLCVTIPIRSDEIPRDDEVTNLSLQMSEMNLAMRRLRKLIKTPTKKEEALRVILNVQVHALNTKGLTPSTITEMPPGEREKALLDYRHRIIGLIEKLLKLEKEILADDLDQAQKTYSDIRDMADAGHKKFRKNEDE